MQVKKALRQARAARTVAIIIGGFLACWTPYITLLLIIIIIIIIIRSGWTPYTITTIVTVTTGRNHSYSVNFAVVFLAFASVLTAAFSGHHLRHGLLSS